MTTPSDRQPSEREDLCDRAVRLYPRHLVGMLDQDKCTELRALIDTTLDSLSATSGIRYWCPFTELLRRKQSNLLATFLNAFLQSDAVTAAQSLLDDDLVFLLGHCIMRRRDLASGIDVSQWHLDADFMGDKGEMANAWIPLVAVGERYPGLTFLRGENETRTIWQHWQMAAAKHRQETGTLQDIHFKPDVESACMISGSTLSERLHTPIMAAGDAVFFNQCTPHRTQELSNPEGVRYSIEYRLAAISDLPSLYPERGLPIARLVHDGKGVSLQIQPAT